AGSWFGYVLLCPHCDAMFAGKELRRKGSGNAAYA
ncbi:hypothetical protein NPIL_376661, partial [Nephila pilipes]